MATNVEDIGLIMEVLGQHDAHDATSLPLHPDDHLALFNIDIQGKRIGIPWKFLEDLSDEAKRIFQDAVKVLKSLQCEIVDIDLNILHAAIATYYIIATAEASTNLARFDGIRYGVRSKEAETLEQVIELSRTEGFGKEVKKRILLGTYVLSAGYQDAYYKQATRVRVKIMESFAHAFEICDLIATPTSPTSAFPIGGIQDPIQMYLQDVFTTGANLAHLPAISVPCGFGAARLPVGLQLIGPKRSDPLLTRVAHHYEKATLFTEDMPKQFDLEF
jgi:aspartyl-tRNA(Asn)/glutamyl-tRNA(Gln) amidotransferase subunit A